MLRSTVAAAFTVVLVASAPCAAQSPAPAPVEPAVVDLPPALDRVLRDYEQAWRTGDGPGLARLFTADGFAVQSGSAIARGSAAIARNIGAPGGDLRLTAYQITGTAAHIVGGFRYPASRGPGGRFVLVLSQTPDGRWLIAADLDNTGPRPPAAPSDDRAQLARLNDGYVRAVLTADTAFFEQHLASEFRNTNPDGTILDRGAFLAQIARGSGLTRLDAVDVEIRVSGGTAIIHARTDYTTSDGRPGAGRYTDVWQRQADGRWLAVAAHVTRLVR